MYLYCFIELGYTSNMKIAVIIPAYNEAERVGETVRSVLCLGEENLEVVVVDDGSIDGTADVAGFAGAVVVQHALNRGQGAALQTGAEWALARNADCIVHFDADGQFDARDIIRAVELLQKSGKDIILGSRTLIENDDIPKTKQYLIHPIARVINWAFTGMWLTDVHNGFRVFSREATKKITIQQDRMAHGTEIISLIRHRKLKLKEMPVKVKYNEYGQGLRGGFKILGDLMLGWFS